MKETAKGTKTYTFSGHNGHMTFDGTTLTVANKNAMKFNSMGPLAIPLESIESVQIKKPTITHSNGHIRIITPTELGPAEFRLLQATSDDKTIMVVLGKNGSAQRFADRVMQAVAARGTTATPFTSEADTRTDFRAKYAIPEDAVLAVGGSGYCAFDGSHVTLQRFVRFGNVTSSVKRIPVDSITAVQIISPRGVIPGTIRFTVPGTTDRATQYQGTTILHNDQNTIGFIPSQEASFVALRSAIEAAQKAQKSLSTAPSSNVLDQIEQLAGLRDSGIVTPEEFEAKKAELLNRL